MKKVITTTRAPQAAGPYSQAIEVNGILFVSGQIPVNPETGRMVKGDIKEQTRQVMENIGEILSEAGYSFNDVVKSTCFLTEIKDFEKMNEVYSEYYHVNKPARSAIAVLALPREAMVEIETIAVKQ